MIDVGRDPATDEDPRTDGDGPLERLEAPGRTRYAVLALLLDLAIGVAVLIWWMLESRR